MMRVFLLIGSSANTPQPWSFDRRRAMRGARGSPGMCERQNSKWPHNRVPMSDHGLNARAVIKAWGRILAGYRPNLSIEITRECPLRCPGCYAYGDDHLGGGVTLRGLSDYKGDELVERFIALVDKHRPLHVSIVGGEPLVRFRELGVILP